MKNFGFTLAEVLITLGIIGVVAALTAPALVKNSGQAKIGPSLAKFVNTFETACEQMMADENTNKITNAIKPGDLDKTLPEALSKYIIMSPTAKEWKIYFPDGTRTPNNSGSDEHPNYILKDGTIIGFTKDGAVSDGLAWNEKGPYKGCITEIYVDINGINGNNKLGSEVFSFRLDNNGLLVPYGSNMHSYLTDINFPKCNPNAPGNSGQTYKETLSCTGLVADNGWKADY